LIGIALAAIGAVMVTTASCLPARADDAPPELTADAAPPNAIWIDSLDFTNATSEDGDVHPGKSTWNGTIKLADVAYVHGVGVKGDSEIPIDLHGNAIQLETMVGVDDEVKHGGSVDFTVVVDGNTEFDSGLMHGLDPPKYVSVKLVGAESLLLRTRHVGTGNHDNDNGTWAGTLIRCMPGADSLPQVSVLPAIYQSPVPPPDAGAVCVNGPSVIGFSPNKPFMTLIAASGAGPLTYSAAGLPTGLSIDKATGVISGVQTAAGDADVAVTVTGAKGSATKTIKLVCGVNKLALTPPMGWNAAGIYGDSESDDLVRHAADLLVSSGLAAHGYQYVVIGDSWEGARDADGNLVPNKRFPDMKALGDYIHGLGLKFGLYSAATERSCSGYVGSAGHEAQDAATFASWGVDYLNYDWCQSATDANATDSDPTLEAAFAKMGANLYNSNRDIVYSISMSPRFDGGKWFEKAGANSWQAFGGLYDDIQTVTRYAQKQIRDNNHITPGHWNDLGFLMSGRVGYQNEHMSLLKPSEQMMQMSMWCLVSSPLFLSCDLAHIDPNAFDPSSSLLLTNDEVLAVDQDPGAKPAQTIDYTLYYGAWYKPLSDGTTAVGLFNFSPTTRKLTVEWSDIDSTGAQPVRDLWKHQDLGSFDDHFDGIVPAHGVLLLKIGKPA
jgi:alpha-galactosidase